MSGNIRCRTAIEGDVEGLATLVRRLAAYHGDDATATPERLMAHGFGKKRRFHAVVADDAGTLVGYALWYVIYNAQSSTVILDLHHLFVDDVSRRGGVGAALVAEVARWAEREGCDRIRVGVAPSNQLGMAFYRHLGFLEKLPNFFVESGEFIRLTESRGH